MKFPSLLIYIFTEFIKLILNQNQRIQINIVLNMAKGSSAVKAKIQAYPTWKRASHHKKNFFLKQTVFLESVAENNLILVTILKKDPKDGKLVTGYGIFIFIHLVIFND